MRGSYEVGKLKIEYFKLYKKAEKLVEGLKWISLEVAALITI